VVLLGVLPISVFHAGIAVWFFMALAELMMTLRERK